MYLPKWWQLKISFQRFNSFQGIVKCDDYHSVCLYRAVPNAYFVRVKEMEDEIVSKANEIQLDILLNCSQRSCISRKCLKYRQTG